MKNRIAVLRKQRFIAFTVGEMNLLHRLVDLAHRKTVEAGVESLHFKDMEARLATAIELPVDVRCPCCGEDVTNPPRVVKDGKVVSSIKKVYLLTETDILGVADKWGIKLTEEQMDEVARFIDDGLDPLGQWEVTIEMAFEEALGLTKKEEE